MNRWHLAASTDDRTQEVSADLFTSRARIRLLTAEIPIPGKLEATWCRRRTSSMRSGGGWGLPDDAGGILPMWSRTGATFYGTDDQW